MQSFRLPQLMPEAAAGERAIRGFVEKHQIA